MNRILVGLLLLVTSLLLYRELSGRSLLVGKTSTPPLPEQLASWPAKGDRNAVQEWRFLGRDEYNAFDIWVGQSDASGGWLALSNNGERTVVFLIRVGLSRLEIFDDNYERYSLPLGPIDRTASSPSHLDGDIIFQDWNGGTKYAGKFASWTTHDSNQDGVPEHRTTWGDGFSGQEILLNGKWTPLDKTDSGGFQFKVHGSPVELIDGEYRLKE